MDDAYVETTILVAVLLKVGTARDTAYAALRRYQSTRLPVYAIKELHGGVLQYHVWFHNKCATLRSVAGVTSAIHAVMRMQPYRAASALEAMTACFVDAGTLTNEGLVRQYGAAATVDVAVCDTIRVSLKTLIFKAWARRRKITSVTVDPLPCYLEKGPRESRGLIDLPPARCSTPECCMANTLKQKTQRDALRTLLHVTTSQQPEKRELKRRAEVLRKLIEKPAQPMTEEDCRALGDAVFALFAPHDSAILTTNVRDLEPLATALGKAVEPP